MALWTMKQHIFSFYNLVRNNESVAAIQREFRHRFNIYRNQAVTTRNRNIRWVYALRTRSTPINIRLVGVPLKARTTEHMECARQALLRSHNRCTRSYTTEHGNDYFSVRRILYVKQHFLPCKLVIGQQLCPRDYLQRFKFARQLEAIFEANDNIILLVMEIQQDHLHGRFYCFIIYI